jgi:tetratricopeptide (TPR) repeat protein
VSTKQGFVVTIGIALAVALFFLRNIPEQRTALDKLLQTGKDSLSASVLPQLQALEGKLDERNPDPAVLDSLTAFWQRQGNTAIAALYVQHKAQATGQLSHYNDCGAAMLEALDFGRNTDVEQNLQLYFVLSAEGCYEQVLHIDSTNITARIGLADVALDGRGQIMAGVRTLLDIVKEDSLNVPANIRLGRMSMVNGEYQNAIRRLKNVLRADSTYAEAYVLLSNAFNAMGQQDEARQYLEQALPHVADPTLRKEIEKRLKTT